MWEQIGILILIGLVSLVDWAIKKSRAQRAQQKQRTSENTSENPYVAKQGQGSRTPSSSSSRQNKDAQDMRRFLEALGLPVDQTLPKDTHPPSPVSRPKPQVSPVRAYPGGRKKLPVSPPSLPSSVVGVSRAVQPAREQARFASQFEHAAGTVQEAPASGAIRHSFRGRTALRQAVIAREVLGPPLALRGEGMGYD